VYIYHIVITILMLQKNTLYFIYIYSLFPSLSLYNLSSSPFVSFSIKSPS